MIRRGANAETIRFVISSIGGASFIVPPLCDVRRRQARDHRVDEVAAAAAVAADMPDNVNEAGPSDTSAP
jgi:hypothetical protein